MTCTEPAYAKLNLTLDILGKRPDGYHDMRMVMQSVTLADEVSVELLPEPGLDILPPQGGGEYRRKGRRRLLSGDRIASKGALCPHPKAHPGVRRYGWGEQ